MAMSEGNLKWPLSNRKDQTLSQGMQIGVKEPGRSFYGLSAFRQLDLPQSDFYKKSHQTSATKSREVTHKAPRKWTLKKCIR